MLWREYVYPGRNRGRCPCCSRGIFGMNCPSCGKANRQQAQTCVHCGYSLRPQAVWPVRPPEALEQPRPALKKPSCLGRLVRQIIGFIVSSIVGWVGGLLTAAFAPFLVQALGSETARQYTVLISLMLAGIPFAISFLMALIGGLIFNRGRRAAA